MSGRTDSSVVTRRAAILAVGLVAGCSTGSPRAGQSAATAGKPRDLVAELAQARRSGAHTLTLARGGSYFVTKPADVSGLSIMGAGSVVRPAPGFVGTALVSATRPCSISGLSISGKGAKLAEKTDGLLLGGLATSDSTLTNLTISDLPHEGISAVGSGGVPGRAVWSSLHVSRCDRGIRIERGDGVRLIDSVFESCARVGAQIMRSTNIGFHDCSFLRNGAGEFAGDGLVVMYSQRIQVRDCRGENNFRRGFSFGGGDPNEKPNREITVMRSVAASNGDHGITVDPTIETHQRTSQRTAGRIVDCTFHNNGRNGINLTAVDGLVATGNRCTSNKHHGISAVGSNLRIVQNSAAGNTLYGFAVFGDSSKAPYGPYLLRSNSAVGDGKGALIVSDRLDPDRVTLEQNEF